MAVRDFKSVGEKATDRKFSQTRSLVPIGFKTPFSKENNDSDLFDAHFEFRNQIRDNLKNLVLTNHGERMGRYNFGANLRSLTTELCAKDDFESEAMLRILDQVNKYMPFVELETFETDLVQEGNLVKFSDSVEQAAGIAIIGLKIIYNVPQLRLTKQGLQVNIYCIG